MGELLSGGEASVEDVTASYGLTALNLAMASGQIEATRLLIAERAFKSGPRSSWTFHDTWNFFANVTLIESSMNVSAMIQDYLNLCSPHWHVVILKRCIDISYVDVFEFSRLNRAILGLSYEDFATDLVDNT